MAKTTPVYALPYPDETDVPDVPRDIKALAERLELVLPQKPGDLRFTARPAVETGYLACEGQAVSRATYKALFEAIGEAYGKGDGSTTFNLPDFRERVPMAPGGTYARGAKGGEAAHALAVGELPGHNHPVNDPGHFHSVPDPGHMHFMDHTNTVTLPSGGAGSELNVGSTGTVIALRYAGQATQVSTTGIGNTNNGNTNVTTAVTGSNAPHNNLQPFTVCNVWIKT